MPSSSTRPGNVKAREVIDLVSSSEEEKPIIPAHNKTTRTRQPLAPRTKVSTSSSRTVPEATRQSGSTQKARKLEITPSFVYNDEDDIFARLLSSVNAAPKTIESAPPVGSRQRGSRSVKVEKEEIEPTIPKQRDGVTVKREKEVQVKKERVEVQPTSRPTPPPPTHVVEDVKPEIRHSTPLFLPASPTLSTPPQSPTTRLISRIQDLDLDVASSPVVKTETDHTGDTKASLSLFSLDSPPPVHAPSTRHSTPDRHQHRSHQYDESSESADEVGCSDHSHHSSSDHGSVRHHVTFPAPPRSAASKNRYDRLKALAESRKTPQTSRSARSTRVAQSDGRWTRSRAAIPSSSEGGSESEEEEMSEESEASEDEDEYDLEKHYDDSLGSLKDFIVDDSDSEEMEEGVIDMAESSDDDLDDADDLLDESPVKMTKNITLDKDYSTTRDKKVDKQVVEILESEEEEHEVDILQYTPPRRPIALELPDFTRLTLNEEDADLVEADEEVVLPTGRKTRQKVSPVKRDERTWKVERERIARKIFDDLDRRVFDSKLSQATIEWNKRLLSTAGRAHCKREKKSDGTKKLVGRIELSEKVLTGQEQILNTVAHEMCHLACFMISEEWKNPHGKVFKSWGRKVMRARPDIEVTTTHNYTIEYKYRWKCSNEKCYATYRRHSKSIDVEKEACWKCASRLTPLFETKASNPFQSYLKDNMKYAKAAMPGAKHGEVMRALSRQWQSEPGADHQGHWRALASAQA